jgi:hypothetical protein
VRADACFAALLVGLALGAQAEELGTLLTTPQERERLERLRRGEPEPSLQAPARGPGRVTGFVKRSDGRNTVWVDGTPVPVSTPQAGRLLDPSVVRGYADRQDDRLHIEPTRSR